MPHLKYYPVLYLFFLLFFDVNSSNIFGQSCNNDSVNIYVPQTLNLLKINGEWHSYYELQLTNCSGSAIRLQKINVISIIDSSVLFSSQEIDLQKRCKKKDFSKNDTTSFQLMLGNSAIFYIELKLPNRQVTKISHLIYFEVLDKAEPKEISKQSSSTKCSFDNQIIVGRPLSSGNWAAIYEPFWENGHRRVIYSNHGKHHIPGRYAIDLIKIKSNGKYANNDEDVVDNWFGYSAEVLCVADGVVSSIRNDFSENSTISGLPEYSPEMATGNYISIKIGDNQFAFYEHLKPNSIKVTIGQKIKKGEVIAALGFTGQTTGPHLHFHIADSDDPLYAEGIPFVFDFFEFLGFYPDFTFLGKSAWISLLNQKQIVRKHERPMPNSVIKFIINKKNKSLVLDF
jgi:murein DD-endopeptidase MepM/ murein hydrolase activator NlpD